MFALAPWWGIESARITQHYELSFIEGLYICVSPWILLSLAALVIVFTTEGKW